MFSASKIRWLLDHVTDGQRRAEQALVIDSRPSDAIAIALRAKVDVLVDPAVLERAVLTETRTEDAVREILEKLRPEDLGDYEM